MLPPYKPGGARAVNVGFLSTPRAPVTLTPAQARVFAAVADAPPGGYRVPAGPDAAAIRTALHALEHAGLVMPAGRAWKLTPFGLTRRADMHAAQLGRRSDAGHAAGGSGA